MQLYNEMAFYSVKRNLKILGIFCRLSIRKKKSQYMKFNNNAWQFINNNLKNPIMIDIYKWLKLNLLEHLFLGIQQRNGQAYIKNRKIKMRKGKKNKQDTRVAEDD